MLKRFSNNNELCNFIHCDEPIVPDEDNTPLTWALVIVKKDDRLLLLHNYNRKQWECPGGGIEAGETAEQAAIREVLEETSQHVVNLQCHGIFKLYLQLYNRYEYGALFTGTIDQLHPFKFNTESDRITLWHPDDELDDNFSELNQWMIEYISD